MVFDLIWKGMKHVVREVPIKSKEIEFDKNEVDKDGNELRKIRNPMANGEKAFVFVDKDNKPVDKHFKAIKGVPKTGYKKTDTIDEKHIEVSNLNEVLSEMVSNEHTYYLIADELKAELKLLPEYTCLICKPYVNRGFKAYKAIIYYNIHKDRVIMKLCRSDIKDAEMPETKAVKEVEAKDNVEAIAEEDIVC